MYFTRGGRQLQSVTMLGNKTIITLVLLGLCAALVAARPHPQRREGHGKRHGLLHEACLMKNMTSYETEIDKTCGCGDVTVPCSWGPLTLTTKSGDTIEATFCDMSTLADSGHRLPGVLRQACFASNSTDVLRNRTCGKHDSSEESSEEETNPSNCTVGPYTFRVGEENVEATFCTPKPRKSEESSQSHPEKDCIEITRHGKHSSRDSDEQDGDDEDADANAQDATRRPAGAHNTPRRPRDDAGEQNTPRRPRDDAGQQNTPRRQRHNVGTENAQRRQIRRGPGSGEQ